MTHAPGRSQSADPASLEGIQVISWDVDGTLYHGAAMKRRLAWHAAREPMRAARELWRVRRFHWAVEASRAGGGGLHGAAERLGRAVGLEVEARWVGPALASVGPRPGVRRALAAAHARGLRQAVFSDYVAEYKVEALGLVGCFERLVAGETLGFVKPSPLGLLELARAFDVDPTAILHVGDRDDTDGAAARAAGARFVLLGRDVRDLWDLAERWSAV